MPKGRPKKIKEVEKIVERNPDYVAPVKTDEKYDEYGVCISCKGGKEGCLHTNLVQNNQSVICVTCGFKVK